jgi:hypothetical protein
LRSTAGNELEGRNAQPGSMLLIRNATVQMPPYLSIYPALRYGLYPHSMLSAFGPAPLYEYRAVDESVRGRPKHERELFIKKVGPNPRVLFTIAGPSGESAEKCERELAPSEDNVKSRELEVTVVLPARLGLITGEPSLLARPLTILGLVASNSRGTFGDGYTVSTYWPAMSTVKKPLLRELGVRRSVLRMNRRRQRRELFNAMAGMATFQGHVVEVIPIAMYD